MNSTLRRGHDLRVLLLALTTRDGTAACQILAGVNIDCFVCRGMNEICREVPCGAGVVIVPEEAFFRPDGKDLTDLLHTQPPWSDLPVLVLTGAGPASDRRHHTLLELGDFTLVRRPLEAAAFITAVRAALRDRNRQYQVRDYLAEQARQAEALREADRRKDEFLAMLAHELRNPLAPIRNGIQILRMAEGDRSVVASTREMMDRQIQHLVHLVDDLLDVSRITRGKVALRKKPVEVGEFVARAVEAVRPLIDARKHRFTVTQPGRPLWVLADLTRMTQVVGNLLNNAAKYGEEGGQITLAVEERGGKVVLRVRDTGAGIAAEMLPKVFDLFTQIDRTLDRSQGGLGIGLTLVRSLVELHGGKVKAFSEGVGRGSEFVVTLPLLSEDDIRRAQQINQETGNHKPRHRILVVDDNVDAAESLALVLGLLGHEVQTVHHGLKVPEAVALLKPDVILLDIGLPGIDGYTVARRLRQTDLGSRPLLIALTGYGQEEDRHRAQEAGFDHHLTKPADPLILQRLLTENHKDG
jgi:signal transduction histidine kinase/ActR/RegA family two-component response regulator